MPTISAQLDYQSAWIDQPKTLCYGRVRGTGNLILQFEDSSTKNRYAFFALGEGPWDSILKLWVNNKAFNFADTTICHFHPGIDGVIGSGMTPSSTGGDNNTDAFFSSLPLSAGVFDAVNFSRYAWLGLKVAPDPGAPSALLTVLGDYQSMKCRIFDSSGVQTSFAYTENMAWWIADLLIRKYVKREQKVNEPLTPNELARFDWASFAAAATYYDHDIGGGIKRFGEGGVVYLATTNTVQTVIEQMLLLCRSYLMEVNGAFTLTPDQPRSSTFTFTAANTKARSFHAQKTNLGDGATNQIIGSFRDLGLATNDSAGETRFAINTKKLDHQAHQLVTGVRGPGLSVVPRISPPLTLDLGNNTSERVERIVQNYLIRQLGDDVDIGVLASYLCPATCVLTGFEDSLEVIPGDTITIDPTLSDEWGGTDFEVMQLTENPSGERDIIGLQYEPDAFSDVALAQQQLQAPGLSTGLDAQMTVVSGALQLLPPAFLAPNVGIAGSYQLGGGSDIGGAGTWVAVFAVGVYFPVGTKSVTYIVKSGHAGTGAIDMVNGVNIGLEITVGAGSGTPSVSGTSWPVATQVSLTLNNPPTGVSATLTLYIKTTAGAFNNGQGYVLQNAVIPFQTGVIT